MQTSDADKIDNLCAIYKELIKEHTKIIEGNHYLDNFLLLPANFSRLFKASFSTEVNISFLG